MNEGSFGSNENRRVATAPVNSRSHPKSHPEGGSFFSDLRHKADSISPVHLVDIFFGFVFLISGIALYCNWEKFSDALFKELLLPVIVIGGKLLVIAVVIVIIIWIISSRFRRWRFWL